MTELSLLNNNVISMSSKEIAELTNKEHKNVLADIDKLLIDLNAQLKIQPCSFLADNGQKYRAYNLDKEATLVLVSGYNTKLRLAIIRRWQELEKEHQPKLPTTYLEALKDLVAKQELIEQQQLALEHKDNQIGNYKTALDNQLDWASIVKVAKHNNVPENTFNWRTLKKTSLELGYVIKKVDCPRYGVKNLYHVDVFRVIHADLNYNFEEHLEN